MKKVCVIGLGYIGLPTAAIIADKGIEVIGVDINSELIESIKVNQQNLVGIEGEDASEWILVDCGDVVVNIMQKETREFYDLESLWGEKTLVSA